MTLEVGESHPIHDSASFAYTTRSGNQFLRGLIRIVHGLLKRTHRRATGLALRAVRPLQRQASVCLADGSLVFFTLGDVYWNPFIWEKNFDYEPEIRQLLQRLKETDYVFFDAGANIGYWSILVSSEMLGRKKAIAIEGSRETFKLLQQNCEANGHRFHIRRNAVFDTDGERLAFSKGPHVARHVLNRGEHGEEVETLTLDTLAQQCSLTDRDLIVIKLDVEGAESAALRGCRNLLQRGTLVIYEDHGSDSTHTATQFVLDDLRLKVFSITTDGMISEIMDLSALARIKADRFGGYNFLACAPGSYFHRWLTAQIENRTSPGLSRHLVETS